MRCSLLAALRTAGECQGSCTVVAASALAGARLCAVSGQQAAGWSSRHIISPLDATSSSSSSTASPKKNPIVFNEFLSNLKHLRIQWRWRCRCRGRCRCLCRCIAHCLQPIASYLAAAAGWPKVRCAVNHMDTIKWKGIGYGNQQHASIARARSLAV